METAGKARCVTERQEHPQRERWKPRHERDAVQIVEPLERWKQLEHLSEPPRLQLPELQQVEGRCDEGQRQKRETQDAERDVQDKPGVASTGGLSARREADEEGKADEAGGQWAGEEPDGRAVH